MTDTQQAETGHGPLKHVRVIEFWGIGPAPFCAMMLADMGASVTCVRRPGDRPIDALEFDRRGRTYVELDLKDPVDLARCLDLCEAADVLLESYRPGVMERLGLGPDDIHARNPDLIYGRLTGWGQDGPYADMAGHDLNYASVTGAIASIGVPERPVPPLNLLADFAGGTMFMALGILAALLHVREGGQGQVIDAAMSDGLAYLMTGPYMLQARGIWSGGRGENILDGGAPYYRCYQCADGEWISLAALEPAFFEELARLLELPEQLVRRRNEQSTWNELGQVLADKIKQRSRAEWSELLIGTDVCFAPVLSMREAPSDPHNVARGVFELVHGHPCPKPAPRFSRTPHRRHIADHG